jgi:hypothetical protein
MTTMIPEVPFDGGRLLRLSMADLNEFRAGLLPERGDFNCIREELHAHFDGFARAFFPDPNIRPSRFG